jgi:hypothetical protein
MARALSTTVCSGSAFQLAVADLKRLGRRDRARLADALRSLHGIARIRAPRQLPAGGRGERPTMRCWFRPSRRNARIVQGLRSARLCASAAALVCLVGGCGFASGSTAGIELAPCGVTGSGTMRRGLSKMAVGHARALAVCGHGVVHTSGGFIPEKIIYFRYLSQHSWASAQATARGHSSSHGSGARRPGGPMRERNLPAAAAETDLDPDRRWPVMAVWEW